MKPSISILVLLCVLFTAAHLNAAIYTVQPGGSIADAVNKATGGDTVLVKAGKYGPCYFSITGGSEGKMLTIKNFPGEMPEINGWNDTALNGGQAFGFAANAGYFRIEGFYVTGFRYGLLSCNWKNGVTEEEKRTLIMGKNIEVRYNVVDLCGQNGISVFFTENVTLENNMVSRTGWESPDHSWSSGINLLGNAGELFVRGNISFHHVDISTHHTDGNGFIIDQSFGKITSAIIENNLAFLNGGSGFGTTSSANVGYIGNTTYNNWQDDNFAGSAAGISFSNTESRSTKVVKNNLCIQTNRGEPIIVYGAALSSLTGLGNNFTGRNVSDASTIFRDAANGDFRLNPDAAAVIAKGTTDGILPNDIGFDPKAIKKETDSRQSFYTLAPDIEYIKSKGGLSGCFSPVARKNPPAIGAYEEGDLAGIFRKLKPSSNALKSSVRKTRSGTVLSFTLAARETVTVSVTDPAGHTVFTTSQKDLSVGKHSFVLPPGTTRGLYLVKITTPNEEIVHKVSGW